MSCLTEPWKGRHLRPMPARATFLDRLRRSGLGVWLAVAYGWGALVLAIAPASALAPFSARDGAVLCSGAPVPAEGAPAPAGDLAHCKGCPLNPVLAGPPWGDLFFAARSIARLALLHPVAEGVAHGFAVGLADSRAPPAA
ncbi:hypothetical protein [Bosea sp. TAF32]|uniref:hypothetical protein n=1 Tax=Bosea sp. TAF32 TaxID=3237482 RepID=UPI003F923BD4